MIQRLTNDVMGAGRASEVTKASDRLNRVENVVALNRRTVPQSVDNVSIAKGMPLRSVPISREIQNDKRKSPAVKNSVEQAGKDIKKLPRPKPQRLVVMKSGAIDPYEGMPALFYPGEGPPKPPRPTKKAKDARLTEMINRLRRDIREEGLEYREGMPELLKLQKLKQLGNMEYAPWDM
jgi:hypothetical protein